MQLGAGDIVRGEQDSLNRLIYIDGLVDIPYMYYISVLSK